MKPLRSRDVDAPWPVLYGTAIIESIEIAFRSASFSRKPRAQISDFEFHSIRDTFPKMFETPSIYA